MRYYLQLPYINPEVDAPVSVVIGESDANRLMRLGTHTFIVGDTHTTVTPLRAPQQHVVYQLGSEAI